MDKWEYDYVTIEWDEKHKVYVHNLRNLAPQVELYAILDHLGADGWEMVNMWPQSFFAAKLVWFLSAQRITEWRADAKYSAVFKRKRAE